MEGRDMENSNEYLERFVERYSQWATQNLTAYLAGEIKEAMQTYPFVINHDSPWTVLKKEIADCKLAMVTSGGLHLKSQEPFRLGGIDGDWTFRSIPKDTPKEDIFISHPHYDHRFALEDLNCIFPLDRFREFEAEGKIRELARTHYSFGYVNNIYGLVKESIPSVIAHLQKEEVDIVFFVPV